MSSGTLTKILLGGNNFKNENRMLLSRQILYTTNGVEPGLRQTWKFKQRANLRDTLLGKWKHGIESKPTFTTDAT